MQIQDMETNWNELNVSRAQWSINEYCKQGEVKQCRPCEKNWRYHEPSCYSLNDVGPTERLTWEEAREYCRALNADLAAAHNLTEKEAAQPLIYSGMAGSKLEGIQVKVNEYVALHNAEEITEEADYVNAPEGPADKKATRPEDTKKEAAPEGTVDEKASPPGECSTQSNNASTNNFTKMSAGDIEALILEKDQLVQENVQLVQEKDLLVQDKKQLVQEKDQLIQEKDQLIQEKDQLVQEKDQLVQEKKQLVQEKDQLVQEKKQLVQEKDQLEGGWQSHNSTCYQLSSSENTWQHAKEDCESKGSHLVVLNDGAEEKVVRGFGGDAKLWMGLSGNVNKQTNTWELTTVDSSPRWYGNWKEPILTVASNIYCAYVDYDPSYLKNWFLVSCQEQHKWMCEMNRA
ncbi:C-type lectin domain family 10 member A [Dissostichus eleginoides]|uniref:C-type lectin domain family 10 member A n=1 Tax=Dissostichus eleginoides TaxID=100907 RepID=A0AAD9FBF1_DISEL|nr:C-type lectin domain family 10 member A [Dissostichus eleginoides]